MVGLVVVDKSGNLNEIVSELEKLKPKPAIERVNNLTEALKTIALQHHVAVLIDDKVEGGLEFCSLVKEIPKPRGAHTLYFVTYEEDIDTSKGYVDQWYVKGLDLPDEIVAGIEYIVSKKPAPR